MSAMADVGIVLGAGGSLAWVYHLGVLEGLRDSGLLEPSKATRVVGTSAGAVVGAALIGGVSTDEFLSALAASAPSGFVREMREARSNAKVPHVASVGPVTPPIPQAPGRRFRAACALGLTGIGLLPASALIDLPVGNIRDWDRRLWVPAVRVRDGTTVVFGREFSALSIRDGLEASCAVPLLFQPKAIGGDLYMDGAIASGTHADILSGDAHDLVIVSAPLSRTGHGWLRSRARRQLRTEIASLHRAGCQTLILIPDNQVLLAAQGYPRRRRELRSTIVDAARRQTVNAVRQFTSGRQSSTV